METQHQKIINLCKDGQWHCGNEFREAFIFSPHKRRIEIEGRKNRQEPITGKYKFLEQKCEHGSAGVKDYLMVENEKWIDPKPKVTQPFLVVKDGVYTAIYA